MDRPRLGAADHGTKVHPGRLIHRPALRRADPVVALAVQHARGPDDGNAVVFVGSEHLRLLNPEVAEPPPRPQQARLRAAREELHGAAERRAAVEGTRSAARHLDSVEEERRQAVPIHPVAEGIVERHSVPENQGAARAARADSAQRDPGGGGVGNEAGVPPEESEPGHPAQGFVHQGARRIQEIFAVERGHERDRVHDGFCAAARGDDYGLRVGRAGGLFFFRILLFGSGLRFFGRFFGLGRRLFRGCRRKRQEERQEGGDQGKQASR